MKCQSVQINRVGYYKFTQISLIIPNDLSSAIENRPDPRPEFTSKIQQKSMRKFLLLFLISGLVLSCKGPQLEYSAAAELNPFKISPLSAQITISADKPCKASYTVLGDSPFSQAFETVSNDLVIPVLGLYPNTENKVLLTLDYSGGKVEDTLTIKTGRLPNVFPTIEVNKAEREKMVAGWHGSDLHFANNGTFRSIPMIFDDEGQVRWVLDLTFHGKMVAPFQRLQDGSVLMVGRHTIYEFDMLGQQTKVSRIPNTLGMHHDVLELPDGTLLICIGTRDGKINLHGNQITSDSDFIMLYDRTNNQILKTWDLAKHLDVSRDDLNFFRPGDWLHMNGLAYDAPSGTIIVSAKNQGLIKIGWEDDLKWIMAPHKNWGKAGRQGDGPETKPFLLTAVDADGNPYSNDVQMGDSSPADFDFVWGPHAPKILPNGNLLVFDNGTYRNFNNERKYSRAVEYKIDESEKTVQQVWQYGKERGDEFYSAIVSDVDFLLEKNNVLVTSGYIYPNDEHQGKIVEVDYETGEVVFEATLYFKSLNGSKAAQTWGQTDILYRSERMKLKY